MRLSVVVQDDQRKYILVWVFSFLIPVFLLFSALFSGLAMSLLTLTRAELKVLRNQGNIEEKKYSRAVTPLRKRGNLLFCTFLIMNTLTNVVLAVLFHELISYYSILAATLLIVFLGEILPQTICSRFGLSYGNKMAWLTNIFVVLAFPFSFPVSKLMDAVLDDEIPTVYNRDQIQEILTKQQQPSEKVKKEDENDLKALKLSNKTVGDVMVKLEEAYMEEYNSVLTAAKVTEIIKKGYTRIPVYDKLRTNVVALLHLKDLTLIDPTDKLTIKTVCKFYNRPVNFVFEDTKLNVMLEEFKKGCQSHMAFVQRVNSDGPGDPYYETLGMVTLEDVIDEIFHSDTNAHKPVNNNVFDPNIHCKFFFS
ncbi:hypothetical protein HELRODRAFT_62561 [Helobdella robusta]|uniref:CNNM transmembrane domain-containing protein n=1 Tax=Helobdella robusta TaxID=6412 RepID=T1FX24_HELRO|nr:hypothetical protein HELRODRAFT_62561 [Helobdella robusta]ESO13032.1 hypothetical protein HELRODRAFT_62561 [Helobdella robusta]